MGEWFCFFVGVVTGAVAVGCVALEYRAKWETAKVQGKFAVALYKDAIKDSTKEEISP